MKKLLCTLLGISVIFALIACSNGNSSKAEDDTSTTKSKTVNPNKGVYGFISGIVVDSYTAAPVEGVKVSVDGTKYAFTTKADGAYYFDNVPVGDYTISYYKDGFRQQSAKTTVEATQYLDDDPFAKKKVIDDLLAIADKVADNKQDFASTDLTNGSNGNSTVTTSVDANGNTVTTQTTAAISGTGTTEDNTFNFEWFVEDIDNYEYKYGITLGVVKLVKLGATVKGKLVGYIPYGTVTKYENFTSDTGTGYGKEVTRADKVNLSGVKVYATAYVSGTDSSSLNGDVWETTTGDDGSFEFRDLPVGTQMQIGFTAFDKTINSVEYSFLNSNVEYRNTRGITQSGTAYYFTTLNETVYEIAKDGTETVKVDNVLDIADVYVKAVAPSPYVVATNGLTTSTSKANPYVGTGLTTPIAVTDPITVTFNMPMDPTEFTAFYVTGSTAPTTSSTDGEQMVATWSEDGKTVSLVRKMDQIFPYTAATDDTYATVAWVYFKNAVAKAKTAASFNAIEVRTIKAIALEKENAVTFIPEDEVPSRAALNEYDVLPFLGAVKLTFTKPLDTTADNKFKVFIDSRVRTTQNWKEIEASDIIYGKEADNNSVYIKADGLEKASIAKIECKVFSTDPKDSVEVKDDNAIVFRTSDALSLVKTNLYGEEENVYYNSLSTGDFGTKVFALTDDIKLTFNEAIPEGAKIIAELYKKSDIAAESTIGGIKDFNLVTGTPTAAEKVVTIKHEDLELNTEYVFGIKIVNKDGFVCFNTKSSVWAKLFTVNKTGTTAAADGLISNTALTVDSAELKDADSYYIWFKTAPSADLKLESVDAYDYDYAYQTTEEAVEYKLLAGDEDIVLTFEGEPYATLPADKECYNVSLVADKTADLDKDNLITSITIDQTANTLTIAHEELDEEATYYLSLEVFADDTLEDSIFTTNGATFAGKEKAKLDGNFITIKTAEANWQLVKANVYNYGTDDKYLGLDSVASITGIEAEAVFQADSAIVLTFNKNISIEDKDVTVVLYSEDYAPTDKEVSGLTAKNIAEDSIPCTFTVTGSELTITPVDETGATVEFEAGKAYWLYVAVTAKEDDTFFYFKTSEVATDKAAYAIDKNVFFENADAEDDDDMIGFVVYKEPNKVFILTDTNLVSFDADSNIYYDANSTTASNVIDFPVATAITLTFTEDLPEDAVVAAELYPVNIIGGLVNNPVELLKRNVVTSTAKAGAIVTVNHAALIPDTDYAFAVKVSAEGYDDFYTKALETITCEPQLRDDANTEYYLIANTEIDDSTDGSYYLVFNTEDGFTALEGEDYATNIALDGTTDDFAATGEDIVIEVNKDISSATNDIKVYWGETKAIAEAKTRETGLSATTPVADKNGTTSVITIDNTTSPVTLVPGYFYNVVIDSDDEVLSYVFQVASDFALGTEKAGAASTITTAAGDIDSVTEKIKVNITPVAYDHNYNLEKEYRYFYAYKGSSFDVTTAEWNLAGTADNLGYLAINTYSQIIKDVELSFAKGVETLTGADLPWMALSTNSIAFIEQTVTNEGTLEYKALPDISDGKMTATVSTVTFVDTYAANDIITWTVTSSNAEPISVTATANPMGDFAGNCTIEVTYSNNFKTATVKVTVTAAVTTTASTDEFTCVVSDVAGNTDTKTISK